MKKFLIIILFFNLSHTHAYSIEPQVFVQSTVNKASQVLSQDISKEEKINGLKIIAKETVDITGIGFYSLGSARKNLDDTQKRVYFDLFEKYFLKSFSSRLAQYSDPKIQVSSEKKLNEKYTIVSSILLATEKTPQVKLDWRIVTKDIHKPLIIDVVIEGVSLAKVQKEEFYSIIQSNDGDINALFKNLKEFIEKD